MGLCALISLPAATTLARGAEPSTNSAALWRPDPLSVRRFGPGYRYPQAGWTVLHIEGAPYTRGFQHGRLLAAEIAELIGELARYRSVKAPADAWNDLRLVANALFLRRFDREYLEEMKGIADGAADAGAKYNGRAIDLLDVVTLNADIETTFLDEALDATATGLEGREFTEPARGRPVRPHESHCSAFAATGPATADGQVVFGHITMWNLFHAYHYNVWLDIKPSAGHRVLMQTYPGGIMSGLDYYMNDRGLVVCETTIAQTKFDDKGIPLIDRIRRALQYGDSIDRAVTILKDGNNGLYSNEWLLADTRTNEVAMFELGTDKSRLWRSGKNDWFGGTTGFYWGCNNAKDLAVRLESVPALNDVPTNAVFHPTIRDRKWLELFDRHARKIDADFGFLAFTTTPLAAAHSLDAKFTTTKMARELSTWAKFGPPLGMTWEPTEFEKSKYPGIMPLVANDWTILSVAPPEVPAPGVNVVVDSSAGESTRVDPDGSVHSPLWHGTILPETDADIWLAAAFADYEKLLSRERFLINHFKDKAHPTARETKQLAAVTFPAVSDYLTAVASRGGKDLPLSEIRPDLRRDEWYRIAAGKGVLLLAALRARLGDEPFRSFMDDFGRAHAGQKVATANFFDAAEKAHGKTLDALKYFLVHASDEHELSQDVSARRKSGRFWSIDSFERQLEHSLIAYGTSAESEANRHAAQVLQRKVASRFANRTVPIKPDYRVTDDDLKTCHILLVGRPAANKLSMRFAKSLPIAFGPSSFTMSGESFAHPLTSVVVAGPNPMAADRSIVVFAGLSAEGTWTCVRRFPDSGSVDVEVLLREAGTGAERLAIPPVGSEPGLATAASSH
jgi:hypothetical protein